MLTFNLKKRWYDAILHGDKRIEYRSVKPYWAKRLKGLCEGTEISFKCGYGRSYQTIRAHVIAVDVGPCPYDGFEGEYFRIKFSLREDYQGFMDPTKYYPGFGVDDMNIDDYYDQRRLYEDDDPEGLDEDFDEDDFE